MGAEVTTPPPSGSVTSEISVPMSTTSSSIISCTPALSSGGMATTTVD